MTADIRTAAQRDFELGELGREEAVASGLANGCDCGCSEVAAFAAGAVWGVARVTPAREQLEAVARKTLIEFTGTCVCHYAYASRGKEDPDCVWHAVGDAFPGDLADAMLALMQELMGGTVRL